MKTFLLMLLGLSLAVPAYSKAKDPHAVKGVYPVSCDDLWIAVKETIHNRSNYGLSAVNDLDLTASFVVVGDSFIYNDRVALIQKGTGCEMKTDIGDIGAEPTNYRQFRTRVEHTLSRQQSAKAKDAPHDPGAPKSADQEHP